jgi:hypothetical protein
VPARGDALTRDAEHACIESGSDLDVADWHDDAKEVGGGHGLERE